MNTIKNLYIIFYTDKADYHEQGRVVQVFTDSEKAQSYLLAATSLNGKERAKDNKWILKVYSYIGSNDCYEYSKWETGQFKNIIGNCIHCHQYFFRENNANMCDTCLKQVKQGLKECEVYHIFFNPTSDSLSKLRASINAKIKYYLDANKFFIWFNIIYYLKHK